MRSDYDVRVAKKTLIDSAHEMKRAAPRPIGKIDEGANAAQQSDVLVQPIIQCFPETGTDLSF